MTNKDQENTNWRGKVKSFSDSMFRNYQIMRKRWEISACEKKRSSEIQRLGHQVFRLYQKKALAVPDIEPQIKKIEKIDTEIKVLEETLRDILMRADEPKQLSPGPTQKAETSKVDRPAEPRPSSPQTPDVKKSAEPVSFQAKTQDIKKPADSVLSQAKTPDVKTPVETMKKPESTPAKLDQDTEKNTVSAGMKSSDSTQKPEIARPLVEKIVTNAIPQDKKTPADGAQAVKPTPEKKTDQVKKAAPAPEKKQAEKPSK